MNVVIFEDDYKALVTTLGSLEKLLRALFIDIHHYTKSPHIAKNDCFTSKIEDIITLLKNSSSLFTIMIVGLHCKNEEVIMEKYHNIVDLFVYDIRWGKADGFKSVSDMGLERAQNAISKLIHADGDQRIRLWTSHKGEEHKVKNNRYPTIKGWAKSDNGYEKMANWIRVQFQKRTDQRPEVFSSISAELAELWNFGGPDVVGHSFQKPRNILTRDGVQLVDGGYDNTKMSHREVAIVECVGQLKRFLSNLDGFFDEKVAYIKELSWQHDALKDSLSDWARRNEERLSLAIDIEKYMDEYEMHIPGKGPYVLIQKDSLSPSMYRDNYVKTYLIRSGYPNLAKMIVETLNSLKPNVATINEDRRIHGSTPVRTAVEVFIPVRYIEHLFSKQCQFIIKLSQSKKVEIEIRCIPTQMDWKRKLFCFLLIRWGEECLFDVLDGRPGNLYRSIEWLSPLFEERAHEYIYKLTLVTAPRKNVLMYDLSDLQEREIGNLAQGKPCIIKRGDVTIDFEDMKENTQFSNVLVFEFEVVGPNK